MPIQWMPENYQTRSSKLAEALGGYFQQRQQQAQQQLQNYLQYGQFFPDMKLSPEAQQEEKAQFGTTNIQPFATMQAKINQQLMNRLNEPVNVPATPAVTPTSDQMTAELKGRGLAGDNLNLNQYDPTKFPGYVAPTAATTRPQNSEEQLLTLIAGGAIPMEEYGKGLLEQMKPEKGVSVRPGGQVVNPLTGQVIYSAPGALTSKGVVAKPGEQYLDLKTGQWEVVPGAKTENVAQFTKPQEAINAAPAVAGQQVFAEPIIDKGQITGYKYSYKDQDTMGYTNIANIPALPGMKVDKISFNKKGEFVPTWTPIQTQGYDSPGDVMKKAQKVPGLTLLPEFDNKLDKYVPKYEKPTALKEGKVPIYQKGNGLYYDSNFTQPVQGNRLPYNSEIIKDNSMGKGTEEAQRNLNLIKSIIPKDVNNQLLPPYDPKKKTGTMSLAQRNTLYRQMNYYLKTMSPEDSASIFYTLQTLGYLPQTAQNTNTGTIKTATDFLNKYK